MIDISLKNVKKSFGGTDILKGVTFDVNEGERVALLGANGAGKTTLLKLLTGQLEPDEGEIFLAPRKRVGLISQIPVYPDGYTTEDVLRSAIRHLDELRDRMHRLEAAMADAERGDYQAVPVHLRDTHYSGASRLGHGQGYLYPHDFPGHYVEQQYAPPEAGGMPYYVPSEQGFERDVRRLRAERGREDPPEA